MKVSWACQATRLVFTGIVFMAFATLSRHLFYLSSDMNLNMSKIKSVYSDESVTISKRYSGEQAARDFQLSLAGSELSQWPKVEDLSCSHRSLGASSHHQTYNGLCIKTVAARHLDIFTPLPRPPYVKFHPPLTPWYLSTPLPAINVTVGRQLFVDDFLIASVVSHGAGLRRVFHQAKPAEPFLPLPPHRLCPQLQLAHRPGGLVWDDVTSPDPHFKLYVRCVKGFEYKREHVYLQDHGFFTSKNGREWTFGGLLKFKRRSEIHTDLIDSMAVFLDYAEANPRHRFKMVVFPYSRAPGQKRARLTLFGRYASADGVVWSRIAGAQGSLVDDRSVFFINPFRGSYNYLIKFNAFNFVRMFGFVEMLDFLQLSFSNDCVAFTFDSGLNYTTFLRRRCRKWRPGQVSYWLSPDLEDVDRFGNLSWRPEEALVNGELTNGDPRLIDTYDASCFGYESLMFCVNMIHYAGLHRFKTFSAELLFSRDGFDYARVPPKHRLDLFDREGANDLKCISGHPCRLYHCIPPGTGPAVVGAKLLLHARCFDMSRLINLHPQAPHDYALPYRAGDWATFLFEMRRDGWASFIGSGSLRTRPLTYGSDQVNNSEVEVFVNGRPTVPGGFFLVTVLSPFGHGHQQYSDRSHGTFAPVLVDSVKQRLVPNPGTGLHPLRSALSSDARLFVFHFNFTNFELYSFWISIDPRGCSGGFFSAGGPAMKRGRDEC